MLGLAGLRALGSRLHGSTLSRRVRRRSHNGSACAVDALEARRLFYIQFSVIETDDGAEQGQEEGHFVIKGMSGGSLSTTALRLPLN